MKKFFLLMLFTLISPLAQAQTIVGTITQTMEVTNPVENIPLTLLAPKPRNNVMTSSAAGLASGGIALAIDQLDPSQTTIQVDYAAICTPENPKIPFSFLGELFWEQEGTITFIAIQSTVSLGDTLHPDIVYSGLIDLTTLSPPVNFNLPFGLYLIVGGTAGSNFSVTNGVLAVSSQ
ncbi:MAG: hypothetical protein ACHQUC_09760 [Chlamydiales bacterium]